MALYRVLHRLAIGKGRTLYPGSFNRLEWLDERGIERLTRKGAIGRISAPPLAVLPGWGPRAERLGRVGLEDTEQFLEMTSATIADLWAQASSEEDKRKTIRETTVEKWKDEVLGWLTADKEQHS